MDQESHWLKSHPQQTRYGMAVVTSLLSLIVRLMLTPVLGLAGPFLLFAPAIIFTAWYGGLGPGLVATGLSCFLVNFFIIEPIYSLSIASSSDLVRLLLFAGVGIQISILSGKLLSARSQAETATKRIAATVLSLEQSEEQYRLMIDNVRDYAIYALDPHGYIINWNIGAERLKGYRAEEALGQHFSLCYPPEFLTADKHQYALERAIHEGRFEEEGWRVRKDGSKFWANVVITALWDKAGNLQGFCNVICDMTERKQAEDQLKKTVKELSSIKLALDQAAILATTDDRGIIQSVNDKFCQISQYDRQELIGQDHRILNSGYHPTSFFRNLWRTISRGKTWQGEIKNRAKDGSYYWVDTTIVPFLDQQGKPFQYLAIRFDITEQKQAETDLQQLNNNLEQQVKTRTAELEQALSFEATLKRITDRVRDTLDEGYILRTAVRELGEALGVNNCNAALYDLEQGTSTICYEHNITIFPMQGRIAYLQDYPELYTPLLHGQYLQFCNLINNPVRGRVSMLACPILDDQGILGDLWLVTDKEYAFREPELRLVQQVANQCAIALRQARLYEASQAQVKALERLNWLKDDFLSTVSHELRTPVSNMKMSIRMLELTLERNANLNGSEQKVKQYLQILRNECEREISLINDLLDLQRLEVGKRSIDLEPIHIETWLPQVIQSFQERARARQQILQLQLPNSEMPPLVCDVSALERILAELLNNACKYTPPEEVITVSVSPNKSNFLFTVSNHGSEIPASELPKIFDKFYRVPDADQWKQGGTGLGLALVQRLTDHIGGTVQVESTCDLTTFKVEIPNQLTQVANPTEM